ncbi:MAG: hypothetical protein R2690_18915 [Acidimicrobiales bacterium]
MARGSATRWGSPGAGRGADTSRSGRTPGARRCQRGHRGPGRAGRPPWRRCGAARHLLAVGVDAFLDEWLAQPLFGGLTVDQAQRSARRANTADGLAAALRDLGTGAQPDLRPALDRLRRRRLPVLVVVGADDAKFTAIGHELVQAIGPTASLSSIAGAGHTAHLERPEPFLEALRQWLGSTAGPTTHDPTTDGDPTIQR